MKLFRVYHDDNEFAVVDYENSEYSKRPLQDIWSLAWNSPLHEIEEDDFIIEALEFKDIDKDFIEFIEDHYMDYDQQKGDDFFVVDD